MMERLLVIETRTFIHVLILWIYFPGIGSSCTQGQISRCKNAALANRLGSLEGGGVCKTQPYVHYTHRCTVNAYRPPIDFCCCAYEQKVLCCRYHQSWDFFRCSEPEDTVGVLSHRDVPLKILLPAILVPVVLLACCAFCGFKYYKHWASQKKRRSKDDSVYYPHTPMQNLDSCNNGLPPGASEMEPLNYTNGNMATAVKRPLEDIFADDRQEPTAPSADDVFLNVQAPMYRPPEGVIAGSGEVGGGETDFRSITPSPVYSDVDYPRHPNMAAYSNPSSLYTCVSMHGGHHPCHHPCPSCSAANACPPPPYEESLGHRIYQTHVQ